MGRYDLDMDGLNRGAREVLQKGTTVKQAIEGFKLLSEYMRKMNNPVKRRVGD